MKNALRELLHVFYPPLCAHCQTRLSQRKPLFCKTCFEQVSLMEVDARCRTCFAELYKGRCDRCIHRPVVIHRQLAACEAMGPARSLANALLQGKRECFPAAASLMAYQWLAQKLPLPDFLIPLPTAFWQKQKHGFDIHLLLAQEVGKIFSVPVRQGLTRQRDWQHFLTKGEMGFRFTVKKNKEAIFCDQRVLLIGTHLDDAVLRQAGTSLKPFFPTQIDALALTAP